MAKGTITGATTDVPTCSYFSGSATLPPDTTLILTKRNLDNGSSAVYPELVHGWDRPASLASWRGAQYFGNGDDSVGQHYEVGLRAVDLEAARAFHDDRNDDGQALARSGTPLDAVRVLRVTGEGPNGCEGR